MVSKVLSGGSRSILELGEDCGRHLYYCVIWNTYDVSYRNVLCISDMIPIKGRADRIGIWITGKSLGNIQWIYLHGLVGEKYGRAKVY